MSAPAIPETTPPKLRRWLLATYVAGAGGLGVEWLLTEHVEGIWQQLPLWFIAVSLHHVTPITRRARICSFFWLQSMIGDAGRRSLLFDLDLAIQRLNRELPDQAAAKQSAVQLTGVYHNLLRQWAEM